MHKTLFVDLRDANDAERRRIQGRIGELKAAQEQRPLTSDENKELALLLILNDQPLVDPLFFAIKYLFGTNLGIQIPNPVGSIFDVAPAAAGPAAPAPAAHGAGAPAPAGVAPAAAARAAAPAAPAPAAPPRPLAAPVGAGAAAYQPNPDVELFAEVYGLMETDQVTPPAVTVIPPPPLEPPAVPAVGVVYTVGTDLTDLNLAPFTKAFFAAVGEAKATPDLLKIVFPILRNAGTDPNDPNPNPNIKAYELAQVIRLLVQRGIDTNQPNQYVRLVNEALDTIQNVGQDQQPSSIVIDLPDLNAVTDATIQPTNIRGLQPVYFAAMFEQMKVFQVVDKLVELFQNGILPINLGNAGNFLYKYWKDTPNRISEAERRNFYARAFGIPGGDDAGMPNREFNDLWLRFVSAVSSYIRQNQLDNLLKANIPGAVTQQQVRKAGRDLAANLSLYGYGMTYFAATDLQKQIKDVITLLSDPDIRQAYGARDPWQVIDQVAMLELGGAVNSVRYRTMATAGVIIMAWLAKRAKRLSDSSFDAILDLTAIRYPVPAASGKKPTSDPTDADLVNACEQWLAVTGTEENQVEQYAQPRVSPSTTSKPIQIPAVARDVLESAGVSLPMGMGMGMGNGYAGAKHPDGYRR
jgi:hypothetical protein